MRPNFQQLSDSTLTNLAALADATDRCSQVELENSLLVCPVAQLYSLFGGLPLDELGLLSCSEDEVDGCFTIECTGDRAKFRVDVEVAASVAVLAMDEGARVILPISVVAAMTLATFDFDMSTVKNGGAQNGGTGDSVEPLVAVG